MYVLLRRDWQSSPYQPTGIFLSSIPHDAKLCPVQTLKMYEQRTHALRSSEILASSTIARWLRTTLEKSGMVISIFKAHSVRGAAATATGIIY